MSNVNQACQKQRTKCIFWIESKNHSCKNIAKEKEYCTLHFSKYKNFLEKPTDCAVCLESIDEKTNPLIPCGHWIHMNCIYQSGKAECPVCRAQLDLTVDQRSKLVHRPHYSSDPFYDEENSGVDEVLNGFLSGFIRGLQSQGMSLEPTVDRTEGLWGRQASVPVRRGSYFLQVSLPQFDPRPSARPGWIQRQPIPSQPNELTGSSASFSNNVGNSMFGYSPLGGLVDRMSAGLPRAIQPMSQPPLQPNTNNQVPQPSLPEVLARPHSSLINPQTHLNNPDNRSSMNVNTSRASVGVESTVPNVRNSEQNSNSRDDQFNAVFDAMLNFLINNQL